MFFTCFAALTVLYSLAGGLLWVRRLRKQVSSRSPLLLQLSLVGNYCEQFLLLGEVTTEVLSSYPAVLSALQVFFHFLYYLPYLLRGYRLYFVFHAGSGDEEEENSFVGHIKRAKQAWLLRVLAVMLVPVVVICCLMATIGSLERELPRNMSSNTVFEAVVIVDGFVEEMLLLVGIYCLRKVEKGYSMTGELSIIALLWYFNALFSLHSAYSFWRYELLCRNTLIMVVSVLWPVLLSYQKPELKESLTLPALYSLPMILQNEVPFDYFEHFLQWLCRQSVAGNLESAGPSVLRLYMALEVYKNEPTEERLAVFIEDFQALDAETDLLAKEQREVKPDSEEWIQAAEETLFSLLRNHYFPRFLKSVHFRKLWRCVEQQELKTSKVNNTSLYGEDLN